MSKAIHGTNSIAPPPSIGARCEVCSAELHGHGIDSAAGFVCSLDCGPQEPFVLSAEGVPLKIEGVGVTGQAALFEPPARRAPRGAVPLVDALDLVAEAWSRRLGEPRSVAHRHGAYRVVKNPRRVWT